VACGPALERPFVHPPDRLSGEAPPRRHAPDRGVAALPSHGDGEPLGAAGLPPRGTAPVPGAGHSVGRRTITWFLHHVPRLMRVASK